MDDRFQLDKVSLDAAKSDINEKLGSLSDFNHDLANAICNIHYYKYLWAPMSTGEMIENALKLHLINHYVNNLFIEMIKDLRDVRNEADEKTYNYACEAVKYQILYLDTFSVTDSMFVTKFKSIFRKPFFDLIPDLVDEMNLYE